jgi:hypothetical protein
MIALRAWSATLLIVLFTAAGAAAQVGSTAQISGTVKDASGGVLPGADVTAIQTDTGFRRAVVSDGSGSYTLPNLPIGPYRLEVALSGFRSYAQTGIVLQVNANPVINVTLPLGDLTETVAVEAAAPLVETRSPSIGTVIDNERIEELPLNGRNPTELIQLAGAAVSQGGSSSRSMGGSNGGQAIAVAGGQGFGVAYLLDGAMHNNPYDNLNLPLPFPDALQEFRVETSSTTANNGMHSGASVNVVTKSGTNLLHGDLFEFNRDHRFNATDFFARIDPATGKRQDDGLTRNQFGGTLGGPIITDRLFFFGGYQGTRTKNSPADLFSFVPTAQMLAGDFSTFASAQCNTTGAVTLRAPFVNNRISPSQFSPAALNLVSHLPTTTDPCGRFNYTRPSKTDEAQYIGKIDYQRTQNDTLFGRYMRTTQLTPPPLGLSPDNILVSTQGGRDNVAHALTLGDTRVISNTTVNAIRFAWNKTDIHRTHVPFGFSASSLGVRAYSYLDDYALISVTNGFSIGGGTESEARFVTPAWQIGDDLTMVRGSHQFGVGGSLAFWKSLSEANVRSPGMYTFNGSITGLGLADFLTGRLNGFTESAPNTLDMQQRYVGLYAQDTWKLSQKATLNYGVRWEPFIAQQIRNGAIYNFSLDRFLNNVHTTVFKNAPAGFLYPGDPEFPNGKAGMNNKWGQFSPRAGFAWDPNGDGRMSIRAGYSLAYDFVDGQFHLNTSVAPPWGSDTRLTNPPGGFDDPFTGSGVTNPFPITFDANAPFPVSGVYIAIDPDIDQPRQQSWNVSWQRQFGDRTALSASYLGTHSDHLWNVLSLNEGQFLGTGPCTLRVPVTPTTPTGAQTFPNCSTPASLEARRKLRLQNFDQGQYFGAVDLHTAVGRQNYNGLLLSVQRRAANGITVNANYTLSKCMGHPTAGGGTPNVNSGYVNPNDIDYDYGACTSDRRHIFNMTIGAQTPQFANTVARTIASDWRVSAIYRVSSGSPLTVSVNTDPAATGIGGQRANVVLDDPYGDKSINSYLNPAAFAQPAPGTYGDQQRGWFTGPGYRNVDLALVRAFRLGGTHRIEARLESFNLFNWTRWDNPQVSLNSSQFGKITSTNGDPRVMQFALKYSF